MRILPMLAVTVALPLLTGGCPTMADTPTTQSASDGQIEILISSGRPLRDAIQAIDDLCNVHISYEDPTYDSLLAARAAAPGTPVLPVIRVFHYGLQRQPSVDPLQLAVSVVDQYNRICPTAKFKAVCGGGGDINVFPVQSMNRQGQLVEFHSLLESKITCMIDGGTFNDAAEKISNAIPKPAGMTFDAEGFSMNMPAPAMTFRSQPARDCFSQLTQAYRQAFPSAGAWSLSLDPDPRWAVISPTERPVGDLSDCKLWLYLEDARPIARAARLLGPDCSFPVIYEDPIYLDHSAFFRDANGKWLSPSGGALLVRAPAGQPMLKTISAIVDPNSTLAGGSYSAHFAVASVDGGVYLRPAQVLDENGAWQPVRQNVLETNVSLHAAEKFADLANDLCKQLSANIGKPVTLKLPDDPQVLGRKLSLPAMSDSAVHCIVALMAAAGGNLDCQLLYDQPAGRYTLRFDEKWTFVVP